MDSDKSSSLNILLVDDNKRDRLAIRRTLEEIGYKITECARGEKALEILRDDSSTFDILVTDYKLPGISGSELYGKVINEMALLPVVLLTGSGSEHIAVEALKAGVDDYVVKDLDGNYLQLLPEVLAGAIRKHGDRIGRQKAEEELIKRKDISAISGEMAHFGGWEWDLASGIITCSDEMLHIYGINPEDYDGKYKSLMAAIHPDDRERVDNERREMVAERKTRFFEYRVIRPSGEIRFVEGANRMYFDDSGELIRMVGMIQDITDRKRAEEEVRSAKLLLEKTFDSLEEGVLVVDPGSRTIIACNPAVERIFGYSEGEVVGRNTEFLHVSKVSYEEFGKRLFPALGERSIFKTEYKMRRKDGTVFLSSHTLTEIKDESGNRTGLVSVMRDITERKLAEEALIELEARYHDLYDNAPDMFASIEASTGNILQCNNTLAAATGYSKEEIIGHNIAWLYHLDSEEKRKKVFKTFLETGEVHNAELQLKRKDGSKIEVSLNVSAVRDEKGAILRSRSVWRDITERKRAEEALRESEEMFKGIFENAAAGVAITSIDGKWLRVNEYLCDMLGYTKEELTSKTFMEITHPDDMELDREFYEKTISGKLPKFSFEKRYLTKTGEVVWVLLSIATMTGLDNIPLYFIAFIQNITERKQVEDALQESEQRFRNIFNNSAIGISLLNRNWEYVDVNPVLCEMIGYTNEELTGKTPAIVSDPAQVDENMKYFEELKEGKRDNYSMEKRYTRKDGTVFWGKVSVTLFKGGAGKSRYIIAMVEDITERKRAEEEVRSAKLLLEKTFDSLEEGVLVVDPGSRTIIACNPAVERIFGYSEGEVVGRNTEFLHVSKVSYEEFGKRLFPALGERSIFKTEYKMRRKDGTVFLSSHTLTEIKDESGNRTGLVSVVRDITERKQAEEMLKMAGAVYENAMEGVCVTDADGVIQFVNPAFTKISGFSCDETIGQTPRIMKSERYGRKFYDDIWKALIDKGHWQGEIWNRHKNGAPYLIRQNISTIKDSYGKTVQYAAVFYDITEAKRDEEEIKYQAYHDLLTGLANRSLFNDRLKQAIGRANRFKQKLALLFIDVDDFKNVNDNFGHHAGDLLLQGIAMRLIACVRDTDTVSRYSGDEFAIIIENIKNGQAVASVAEKIMKSLSDFYIHQGKKIVSTVSIGIAIYPTDSDSGEAIIKNADLAMYQVKAKSKNNFSFFTESLNEKATRRHELEYKMREGLERIEFIVYYQPKVSISSGKITGVEALVRWKSDGKLIPPSAFIPLAEETGLILRIGEFVLFSACEQLKAWHDMGYKNLTVSVNISARQIDQGNLIDLVRSTLTATGISADSLCLEVTETAIMEDMDAALVTLNGIKKMGVHISLDDFGTGYSSLSHLRTLPIDELKIDRFFIISIPDNKEDSAIAATIISMAQILKLCVVAEGIETKDQLDFLRSAGCDEIQGYLFSRPVPAEKMGKLLKEGKTLAFT